MKLGTCGLSLRTRTGAGGTATIAKSFFGRSPWLHGHQVIKIIYYTIYILPSGKQRALFGKYRLSEFWINYRMIIFQNKTRIK